MRFSGVPIHGRASFPTDLSVQDPSNTIAWPTMQYGFGMTTSGSTPTTLGDLTNNERHNFDLTNFTVFSAGKYGASVRMYDPTLGNVGALPVAGRHVWGFLVPVDADGSTALTVVSASKTVR
jgi:hypothetical protein